MSLIEARKEKEALFDDLTQRACFRGRFGNTPSESVNYASYICTDTKDKDDDSDDGDDGGDW